MYVFQRFEQSVLKPLPTDRFSYGEWKKATVNIDYHVVYDDHFYSAPYQMVGDAVWIRATALTIEIFKNDSVPTDDNRVGSHLRSHKRGGHTTSDAHRSVLHLKHAEWTPERIINWAKTIGENTAQLVEKILAERKHPEHGFRSCLGIIRLDKKYGRDRLEAACAARLPSAAARTVTSTRSCSMGSTAPRCLAMPSRALPSITRTSGTGLLQLSGSPGPCPCAHNDFSAWIQFWLLTA